MKFFNNEGTRIFPPFEPKSSEPKDIAKIIDKFVTDNDFRKKQTELGYNFVKQIATPEILAPQWDKLFEEIVENKNSITKQTNGLIRKLRLTLYLVVNRLHKEKIKKIFR